jgi:hypothetical protein
MKIEKSHFRTKSFSYVSILLIDSMKNRWVSRQQILLKGYLYEKDENSILGETFMFTVKRVFSTKIV